MKFHKPWLSFAAIGALLAASQLAAQQAPNPPASSTAPAAPMALPSDTGHSAVYHTQQGELTVHSTLPETAPMAPPSFEQLSNGGKSITEAQASAYPLLANDFGYADSNHDKRVSRAEYTRWSKQQ